ncbi:MAG: hypothetical protein PVF70_04785 [Anaerolineales bacterium]|jgi:glutamate synthase domain-containing protein 1/glutamate synthase domain-containing protein 3
MKPEDGRLVERLVASRKELISGLPSEWRRRKSEAEGGCGVIGMASSVPFPGRNLLPALRQMRNRGNGKGGGVAMVGLLPEEFGVTAETMRQDYLVTVAYLDASIRAEVERTYLEPTFHIDHVHRFPVAKVPGLETPAPEVQAYFVKVRPEVRDGFAAKYQLEGMAHSALEDEVVYRNSFDLNRALYASLGEKRAFVLSHGKDMLVLKMVGYGDDVIYAYQLSDIHAQVWIGHHRYPTKGRVWHPGGAHPFVGLHEALVHNGDFANYASVCSYLAQKNIHPLFLTDTEVSVQVFDLLHRTYGYPLEYVIEALAPTTERDFTMLPLEKQRIYRMLQAIHMHGSPDGPWFFLIAQSAGAGDLPREARLIGITDTSMLRPQVFALQQGGPGEPSIGLAASEKQAIDAALESLAAEDARFWPRPDRTWAARGGSHTDGGAFIFSVRRNQRGEGELICSDKFGRRIEIGEGSRPYRSGSEKGRLPATPLPIEGGGEQLFQRAVEQMPRWRYRELRAFLRALTGDLEGDQARRRAIKVLTLLTDRRYACGEMRPSSVLSLVDAVLGDVFEAVRRNPSSAFVFHSCEQDAGEPQSGEQTVVVEARGYDPEGPRALCREIVRLVETGFRHLLVSHARGHRFIGNGLGSESQGVRLEVYGSSGDYLGSGIDGACITVHGAGQDQLAQIMKRGRLVVHGDVGQTFMYAAKGGQAFVLGSAAGRPLINAVGRPRAVINGTCLDYMAESFMAGDPLNDGGFVILNGVAFNEQGQLRSFDTPYPGGNLFSLASGGAIFLRDPFCKVGEDQLNGGEFGAFGPRHWALIRPLLDENERLFGIPVSWLLQVNGESRRPEDVYRVIVAARHKALQPEEVWVAQANKA